MIHTLPRPAYKIFFAAVVGVLHQQPYYLQVKKTCKGGKALFAILFTVLCAAPGCMGTADDTNYSSPPGYNLTNPIIIHLKSELDEISGLSYYAKDSSLFAIGDEDGILFKISLKKPITVSSWKFGGHGDYEDILLLDSVFYALKSKGVIKALTFTGNELKDVADMKLPLEGTNEFESMYYDADSNKIVALCKDCEADKHNAVSAYAVDRATQSFASQKLYAIDGHRVRDMLDDKELRLKPSAAAIHPLTHELYVVSSVAGALVVCDVQGHVKTAYKLNPRFFKQPEGIAFSPNGTMFISNEQAGTGSANIMVFTYKSTPR